MEVISLSRRQGSCAGKFFEQLDCFSVARDLLNYFRLLIGINGVGSSPLVSFRYSLMKSGFVWVLRTASLKISTRSLGVPGGRSKAVPMDLKARTMGNFKGSGVFSAILGTVRQLRGEMRQRLAALRELHSGEIFARNN